SRVAYPAGKAFVGIAHDLHVLRRHRPLSIARFYLIVSVPFMPAASWPSTLQKNVYLPGLRFSESDVEPWLIVWLQPTSWPLGLVMHTSWVTADGFVKSIVTAPALPLRDFVS